MVTYRDSIHYDGFDYSFQEKVARFFKFAYAASHHIWFWIRTLPFAVKTGWFYFVIGSFLRDIQYGPLERNTLDLYTLSNLQQTGGAPVVIFYHGGGWGGGDKMHYCLLGKELSSKGIVTVIPNYTLSPKGTIGLMVADLAKAVNWTYQNIEQYGGDKNKIYIVGHSAGAHIAAMHMLKLLSHEILGESHLGEHYIEFKEYIVGVQQIKGYLLYSGVYDIADHYLHEASRGVENISMMKPAMKGRKNFNFHSPSLLIKHFHNDHVKHFPPVYLFHGDADGTVPINSTRKFYNELKNIGVEDAYLYEYSDLGHADVVVDLMTPGSKFHKILMTDLKSIYFDFSVRRRNVLFRKYMLDSM